MASVRLLLGILDPATSAHLRPSNTGLTEWTHDATTGRWELRSYNEALHLLDVGDEVFSTDTARAAAERDELGGWVARFLASPGSDNAPLGEDLSTRMTSWLGPVLVPHDRLNRLAGPAGEPVLQPLDEDDWRDDVDDRDREEFTAARS
jgi:hypothetical protein